MECSSMEGSSNGLRKGAWTAEEDSLLRQCIDKYGEEKWHRVPSRAGLNRCRKSCRLRWVNYLKPGLNREKLSSDEVDLLLRLHKLLGNRWSLIAGRLPGRTANDVKNYWNTNMGKKQENCCESKMRKRDMTSLATTSAGLLEVGLGEVSTNDGSITCNKDEEKFEFVNNLMDGETIWRKSLLEESQEANVVCPPVSTTDEADNSLINSMSSTFDDVDQLWNLFDANI